MAPALVETRTDRPVRRAGPPFGLLCSLASVLALVVACGPEAPEPVASPTAVPSPAATAAPIRTLLTEATGTSCPASGTFVSRDDPRGDLVDASTGEPADGPGYVDVRVLEVRIEGADLSVRFGLFEAPPRTLDPTDTTVAYRLLIDVDRDGRQDHSVDIESVGGWTGVLTDWERAASEPLEPVVRRGRTILARVAMARLGSPCTMRVRGVAQYAHLPTPDEDRLAVTELEDGVPDDGEWLSLDEG